MLPSIQAPSKKLSSTKPKKLKSKKIKVDLIHDQERTSNRSGSPFLPLLPEGSLTSFVSSRSSRSRWKDNVRERESMKPAATKLKQRGGGFRDYVNQRSTEKSTGHTSIAGVKTHDLQLTFPSAMNVNTGWSVQNPNPRLLKLQSSSGKFNADLTAFNFKNVTDYSLFSRTLVAPHVDFLYHQKQTASKEEKTIVTDGTMATLNNRFRCPPLNITENVLELPRPQTHPSPEPLQVSTSLEQNESSCVHKKACGCHVHLIDRDNISSRSLYNRWERKSTSSQRMKIISSSSSMIGSKVRSKQADKSPPSPPKIPLKKTREMSLENLRRKVKKAVNQNSNSHDNMNEKIRRSSHTNTSSNKKLRNRRGSKIRAKGEVTKEDGKDLKDEAKEQEIGDESCFTQRDVEATDIKEHVVDTTSEPKQDSDHMVDALTVIESISTAATPTSIRRLTMPRILKINYAEGQNADEFSFLRKVFTKLDSDGDGHLSFDELKRSLPRDLTKRQLDYLRKIYLMACESTFFGFEEFVAVNQMCDIIAHVSPSISNAFESIDINSIEEKLTQYLELFTHLDRKQTGSLDISSFKELLASTMNVQQDDYLVSEVLHLMGKENTDVVSSVELLVLVPYLVQITPS